MTLIEALDLIVDILVDSELGWLEFQAGQAWEREERRKMRTPEQMMRTGGIMIFAAREQLFRSRFDGGIPSKLPSVHGVFVRITSSFGSCEVETLVKVGESAIPTDEGMASLLGELNVLRSIRNSLELNVRSKLEGRTTLEELTAFFDGLVFDRVVENGQEIVRRRK